ncbi:SRPBCC family protein [Kitasatospora sp. NPDC101183]|uniref:SRPBCC family protein n=1 Tax=Kitasatospora sp. NPDC101183 TaxID=3364100 RepID=UPI00381B45C9
MAGTYVSTLVQAPAEEVWALIGDFHRLGEWHPGLPPSTAGNELHGNAIGSIRVFEFNGVVLRETLLAYDAEGRSHTYGFPDGTFALVGYRATLRLAPVTELGASFVEWSAVFDVDPQQREESTALVQGVFTTGLAALRERFARQEGRPPPFPSYSAPPPLRQDPREPSQWPT